MGLEIVLVLFLLAGLVYFLLDSTAVFTFIAQWVVAIAILIFLGSFIAIGIHYTDMIFGW